MSTDHPTLDRVRVAAVNDYELVVVGVAEMLSPFSDRLDVCDRIVIGERIDGGPVDVALYDTYGRCGIVGPALAALQDSDDITHLAMFSMDLRPQIVDEARAAGVRAFISKTLTSGQVVGAIESTATGVEVFAAESSAPTWADTALAELSWPGKERGLSERESEVLVLVGEGLTNGEIGAALYLSIETVKSHVSTVIAKLEVRNRVQAATYVAQAGAFTRYQPADPPEAPTSRTLQKQ